MIAGLGDWLTNPIKQVVDWLVSIYNVIICIPDEMICWIVYGGTVVLNLFIDIFNSFVGWIFDLTGYITNQMLAGIIDGLVLVFNYIMQGLSFMAQQLLYILPNMPDLPSVPDWIVQGYLYVEYWFPVGFLFNFCLSLITLWLAWALIAILLRWGKVISGSA